MTGEKIDFDELVRLTQIWQCAVMEQLAEIGEEQLLQLMEPIDETLLCLLERWKSLTEEATHDEDQPGFEASHTAL